MSAAQERAERKERMQASSWIAASKDGVQEYIPISSTPLDSSYQRSNSAMRNDFHSRSRLDQQGPKIEKVAPAGRWVAGRYVAANKKEVGTFGASIVLGSDPLVMETSNTAYGALQDIESTPINLLETVQMRRDTTLDGAHRASMTEKHFLQIHSPYDSHASSRAASFQSGYMLRENMHRHVRSQYHPEEKYDLPPSVQNEIGWGISAKYRDACSKFQEGAAWHGRTGSHITKFSERLLLGARHHLSGPMTNPKLHY